MTTPVVVGIGEVLWDLLETGAVLGGAPANFACHSCSFGAEVFLVSAVGDDQPGRDAIRSLASKGIDTRHVQTSTFPTGTVNVSVGSGGEPTYEIDSDAAWDHVAPDHRMLALAERADAVCFGTLFQRSPASRDTLTRFLHATRSESLRIVDINLRAGWFDDQSILRSLELANVLKLNAAELPVVLKAAKISGRGKEAVDGLLNRFQLKLVALTDGDSGSRLFTRREFCFQQAEDVEVRDTVGAGDAYTACLVSGLLNGLSLSQINHQASRIAAWVCTQNGATPPLPPELSSS